MTLPRRWRLAATFALAAAAVVAAAPARGEDAVIFRDGFVLRGRVFKEKESLPDMTKGMRFDRFAQLDIVESGPKWYFFSTHQRKGAVVEKDVVKSQASRYVRGPISTMARQLPVLGEVVPGEFDRNWRRKLANKVPGQVDDVLDQVITSLDPRQLYLYCTSHRWNSAVAPSEVGPDAVRRLLSTHPDLRDSVFGFADPERRVRIARFLKECGWFAAARAELERAKADAPWAWPKKATDAWDDAAAEIDTAETAYVNAELEVALKAGRWADAAAGIAYKPKTNDPTALSTFAGLRATVQTGYARHETTARLLRLTLDRLTGKATGLPAAAALGGFVLSFVPGKALTPEQQTLARAGEAILKELHPDNAGRLQGFAESARQDEQQLAAGRPTIFKVEELLALAASAWVAGAGGQVKTPAWGADAWAAREMALGYLKEPIGNKRAALLQGWLGGTRPRDADPARNAAALALELAQLVGNLPPTDPEDPANVRGKPLAEKAVGVPGVVRVTTGLAADGPQTDLNYFLKLPPEYHHGRPYPLLVAINHAVLPAENMLGWLAAEAARRGYILAAPEWGNQFTNTTYDNLGKDHPIVLATLRDVARKFQVDPDRVYLAGFGEGANFALDLAMSKPDRFAGVVAVSPSADDKFYMEYYRNAQKLPVMTITGEMAGVGFERARGFNERWLPYGYPMLMCLYKGRGFEWYGAEVPTALDWLDRKKRVRGNATLRLGDPTVHPWQTMRDADDRFYWIGGGDLRAANRQTAANQAKLPGEFWGDIKPGNEIVVSHTRGVQRVTVWLERDMIDWDKPVKVTVAGQVGGGMKPTRLAPDPKVMFEELYRTGDRKMLFFGRLEFKVPG